MRVLIRCLLISVIVLAASLSALAQSTALNQPGFVPGEILVQFASALDATQRSLINDEIGTEVLSVISKPGVVRVHSLRGDSTSTLVAKYLANPFVEYAEPNSYYYLQSTPNDPKFTCQWGLNNWGAQGGTVGVDIQAPAAWNVTTGTPVIVAVLDTGVDTSHADLVPNLVAGYNFVSPGNPPTDTAGHGTHVAGIIGGKGNNSTGITGINWSASIMPLKISDAPINGGTLEAVAQAVYYAIDHGARIINASFVGPNSATLEQAIEEASSAGILVVAAAGNSNIQITSANANSWFPCTSTSSNVICVAATDRTDHLADFGTPDPGPVPSGCPTPFSATGKTNYGSGYVDLAAPGKEITSTWITANGAYATDSGTSLATPQVSGTAALLLSYNTNLTVSQLKSAILNNVDLVPALAGKVATNGRVNAFAALQSLEGLPHAYGGYADAVSCSYIAGWAWDSNHESTRVNVDIYDGATKIGTATANTFRADILAAGIGDGYHAFSLPVPSSFNNGVTHTVSVKFAGTSTNLGFSPLPLICQASMFTTQTPTETDTAANYEDGTQFSSSVRGSIVGLRYWRAVGETGTHIGRLWDDATGHLLGQLTFTSDTGSGWITTMFSSPIAITANTVYRVSYNQNAKNVKVFCGLNPPITNGPLTALQGGYITPSGNFPGPPNGTNTCSNLFADVIFSQ